MLLFKQIDSNLIGVKKIDSSIFSSKEINQVLIINKISSKKRALEILSTKSLLNQMGEDREITYNSYGAPQISKDKYISVSHSAELVSIILSKNKCGLEIERDYDLATLIWSAKECIFKLYQKGNINFKEDIIISKIDSKKNKISVLFKEEKIILNYQKINNHFLVYFCR